MYKVRFFSVVLGLVAVLAVAATLLLIPSDYFLHSGNVALTQKLAALNSAEIGTIATKQAAVVQDINSRLAVFQPTAPSSPLLASLIDPVIAAKPAKVKITDFSYAEAKGGTASVEIRGVAESREALLAFSDALRKVPNFTDVAVPIENFIKGSNIQFSIQATIALR